MRTGTRDVRVSKHVQCAVHTRGLAIPKAEHAVVARLTQHIDLLGPPDGCGGQVFIHSRLKVDVVAFQMALGLPQSKIIGAEWRTTVARYVARGIETRLFIALAQRHRKTRQHLHAIEEG